jgi:hypothetical protein
MATQVKDKDSVDANGKHLLWSNTVKNVKFYNAGSESWDRTGGGETSWYKENTLPYDSFTGNELGSDKWSFFNYRGTVSGTIDNKLFLTISGSDARGGITSSGKWKLTGDFDIRLYFDESSYYNEYRGSSATGLTVSVDESNKFRVSKYFDRENAKIGYAAHYVNDFPLKYSLWTEDEFTQGVGESDITCMRMVRSSGEITGYVSTSTGFTKIGTTKTGSSWNTDIDVEIEVETEQFNYYSSDILGFSVSGTLSDSKVFSTPYRGTTKEFPERALIVVDDEGMSILDEDELSLWMRFIHNSDYMFKSTDCNVSASNGKIYYTTISGLMCVDFVNDKSSWYTSTERKDTNVGISMRNFKNLYYTAGSSSFLLSDEVLDVDSENIGTDEFVVAGTVSGTGMLINQTIEKTEQSPEGSVRVVKLSSEGNLYWNFYDSTVSRGKVFYRQYVQPLVSDLNPVFTPTGYYSLDTSPTRILSEYITDISINNTDSHRVILSHIFGLDYITNGVRITYGPKPATNPVSDPSFSQPIGIYWFLTLQSLFNVFNIYTTSEWSTSGSNSVRMQLSSSGLIYTGNYAGIYQQVDLTGIDRLYFDYKLVNTSPATTENYINLEVVVNGNVLALYRDSLVTHTSLNNYVDVSSYSGSCSLMFIVKSAYNGTTNEYNYFYIDNIRIVPEQADYEIIPTAKYEVKEALLLQSDLERKIFFATESGYGSIDIDSNSLDYFVEVASVIPLSYIKSAEYVEYVNEV